MNSDALTRTFEAPELPPREQLRRWFRSEFAGDVLLRSLTAGFLLYLLEAVLVISFSALIFKDRIADFLPTALGLTLIGNAVLCLVVGVRSTYAGSTAAVQDTPGVILAVAVAAAVAGLPAAGGGQVMATVFALVFGSTILMGLGFLLVGVFRMGDLVRYLPYPVMGGFLAGTGWLLALGGIGVMQDTSIGAGLFAPDRLLHWLPGLIAGGLMVAAVRKWQNPSYLIIGFLVTVTVFFAAAWISGADLESLQSGGWLLGPFPETGGWGLPWNGALFENIDRGALLRALPDALSAVFLGLIALLLNASSLELVIKKDMDLNRELITLGIANMLSGAVGGLMGYHAISLSTLNHAFTKGKRLPAMLVGLLLVLTVILGTQALSYIPRILLGSLLCYLGLGLLYEWLVEVWRRFNKVDVFIILTIFAAIVFTNFLLGIGFGLILTIVLFVVSYSRVQVVHQILDGSTFRSRVQRDPEQAALLHEAGGTILILKLEGFIFFGTANSLYEKLHARLRHAHGETPVRHVVLDFDLVTGLDSTGLLSFRKLLQYTQMRRATLVISGLSPREARVFEHAGFKEGEPGLLFFKDLDRAAEHCETELLNELQFGERREKGLREHLLAIIPDEGELERLLQFMVRREYAAGEYLMSEGQDSDELMLVESGQVTVQIENEGADPMRLETTRTGGLVGELGFFLQTPRSAHVIADAPTTVRVLCHADVARMQAEAPDTVFTLSRIVVHRTSQRVISMTRLIDALEGKG